MFQPSQKIIFDSIVSYSDTSHAESSAVSWEWLLPRSSMYRRAYCARSVRDGSHEASSPAVARPTRTSRTLQRRQLFLS